MSGGGAVSASWREVSSGPELQPQHVQAAGLALREYPEAVAAVAEGDESALPQLVEFAVGQAGAL